MPSLNGNERIIRLIHNPDNLETKLEELFYETDILQLIALGILSETGQRMLVEKSTELILLAISEIAQRDVYHIPDFVQLREEGKLFDEVSVPTTIIIEDPVRQTEDHYSLNAGDIIISTKSISALRNLVQYRFPQVILAMDNDRQAKIFFAHFQFSLEGALRNIYYTLSPESKAILRAMFSADPLHPLRHPAQVSAASGLNGEQFTYGIDELAANYILANRDELNPQFVSPRIGVIIKILVDKERKIE